MATAVVEVAVDPEDAQAAAMARETFAAALSDPSSDIFVEPRGPGSVAVWFTVPNDVSSECGDYPPPLVREHLRALGFARVVVQEQNQSRGLCSFSP